MKTLNRTLSLVLVLVMVLGLIGVAGAADFKDKADIENTEAVNTMAALNIINGKDGNVFDPAGQVTRGEMAKMICVALNGGKEPVLSTNVTPTYSDTQGHWAAGYIEYCSNLGIVAGTGDGTFTPNLAVTGSQAAKMMLVAMNYKADVFGFTGAAWETSVNVEANKAGLYKDLSINAGEALSRDNAAQLIYNGINAQTMQRSWSQEPSTGKITETYSLGAEVVDNTGNVTSSTSIAYTKFGLKTAYGTVGVTTYNATEKKYTTALAAITGKTPVAPATITTDVDYSAFYGQQVKVLYKATDDIYGMYAYKTNVVLAGVVGQLSDANMYANYVTLNGTKYEFDTTSITVPASASPLYVAGINTVVRATPVEAFNTGAGLGSGATVGLNYLGGYYVAATTAATGALASYTFKAIDVDGNGKIDKIVVYPFSVAKVVYVDDEGASLGSYTGAVTEIKFADDNCYTGVAKGDWVKITAAANTAKGENTFEKITPMAGDVTRTTTAGVDLQKAMINGMYFVNLTGASMGVGNGYKDVIQVNTFIFHADQTASATSKENYAVVMSANADTLGNEIAKILLADGTKKTVSVKGTRPTAGDLYQYTVNSSDEYTFTTASGTVGGYVNDTITNVDPTVVSDNLRIGGYAIADDAVVFYVKGTDYDVMTGKQLKTYSDNDTTGVDKVKTAFYTTNSSTGYSTIQLAYVTLGASAASTDAKYGYALSTLAEYREDGTTLYNLTYWNGTEEVKDAVVASVEDTVDGTDFNVAAIDKGTFFKYTTNSKGQMVLDQVDADASYVTAVDGKNVTIAGATNGIKTDDDTVFFYINSAEKTYSKGGELQLAKGIQNNVVFIDAGTANGAFKLIIVDIKNNMVTSALDLG